MADHPCNLTRTAVKISFPAMKEAVFVNFLGYREPNLQYVMRWECRDHVTIKLYFIVTRCKGICGSEEAGSVEQRSRACVPTRVSRGSLQSTLKY